MEMQDQDRALIVVESTQTTVELIAIGEFRGAIRLGRFGRHDA